MVNYSDKCRPVPDDLSISSITSSLQNLSPWGKQDHVVVIPDGKNLDHLSETL